MPDRRSILRLFALAGFLLTVALAIWLAELRPLYGILVMAVGLLVAWTIEWLGWGREPLRPSTEAPADAEAPAPVLPEPAPEVAAPVPVEQAPAAPEPEPAPESEPLPVEPAALEPPVPIAPPVSVAVQPPPEPEPEPAPIPEAPPPEPPRPALRPVPPPPPSPPFPAPAAEPVRPAAASRDVIDLRRRVTLQPRRWNLWDLERLARDEAQNDPLRYEEWSYLFVNLRQFATPDGSLPLEFDDLVRESFGELLEHAGR